MTSPTNSAATTASAAPSVAVTTPPKMPPRMMIGSRNAHSASRAVLRDALSTRSLLARQVVFDRASEYAIAISAKPPSTPGTMPATNSCTTDVSAITA